MTAASWLISSGVPSPIFHAKVNHGDAVGDIHDQADVVLDQHDCGVLEFVDIEDEARHILFLFNVHAGHRLVEQEQGRLERERPPQLNPFAQAVAQGADDGVADMGHFEEVDDRFDALTVGDFFALSRTPKDCAG